MRIALLVLLAYAESERNCSNDEQCLVSCRQVGDAAACDGIACEELHDDFSRCVCAEGFALRSVGSCAPPVVQRHLCQKPSHQVLFNVGAVTSPELQSGHLSNGTPSAALSTVLVESLAAALSRQPQEVEVFESDLIDLAGDGNLAYFDWKISFCAAPAVTPEQDVRGFEGKFISEAQRFAVFYNGVHGAASISVLELTSLVQSESDVGDAENEPSVTSAPASLAEKPSPTDGLLDAVWWLPWILCLLALLAFATWCISRRREKHKAGEREDPMARYSDPELLGPDGSQLQWLPAAGAYAVATHSFVPEELPETEDGFKEGCLSIQAGDVLEVEASGGLWLYGKLAQEQEKSGFFPMNRVAWLGHPLRDDLPVHTLGRPDAGMADWSPPASPAHESNLRGAPTDPVAGSPVLEDAHGPCVYVTTAFNASEVDDATGRLTPQQCLTVAEGEAVKVTAAGAGWLYGHVVGDESRAGYFPEDRATWDIEAKG